MGIANSRTFRIGGGEAVRLPEGIGFGLGVDVTIVRSGQVLTIYPSEVATAKMISKLEALPRPTSFEIRDNEEIPERGA